MIVEFQIVLQLRFEFCRGLESLLTDDLADPCIQAFNHTVRLWMARRNQSMLKAKLLPEAIKNMLTIGFLLAAPAGETIRELATVIGEQFDDLGRACLRHFVQGIDAAAVAWSA